MRRLRTPIALTMVRIVARIVVTMAMAMTLAMVITMALTVTVSKIADDPRLLNIRRSVSWWSVAFCFWRNFFCVEYSDESISFLFAFTLRWRPRTCSIGQLRSGYRKCSIAHLRAELSQDP